jgi:hypothetical protein
MSHPFDELLEQKAIEAVASMTLGEPRLALTIQEVVSLSSALSAKRHGDALERIATALEKEAISGEERRYEGPIGLGVRFVWEPDKDHLRETVEVVETGPHFRGDPSVKVRPISAKGCDYWVEEERFREACWMGPVE